MLREILARFGIRVNTAPLAAANTAISSTTRSLGIMGGLLAAGLIVRGLRNFIGDMIELGDETAKVSRQLGISADRLSAWRFAAERAGVPANQLTNGLRRLQRNIVDASDGLSTAVRAFGDLNVEFETSNGEARELDDILFDVADGFVGLTTQTQRSARAQALFGRAGAQLLPFFENGSEGIQEMLARFEELTGGGFGDFFERAEAAQDALADWDLSMTAMKTTIVVEILPAITRFLTKGAEFVAMVRRATMGTDVWQAAFVAIGAVAAAVGIAMVAAFIGPLVTIGLVAAAIFLIVLAVQDLIAFSEGGESIIGSFLESIGADVEGTRFRFNRFVGDFTEFWGTEFPALVSNAARNFGVFTDDFSEFWGPVLDTAQRNFSTFIDDFSDFWGPVIDRAIENFTQLADAFIEFWGTDVPDAIATAVRAFNSITGGVFQTQGQAGSRSIGVRGVQRAALQQNQNVNVTIDNRGSGEGTAAIERAVRSGVNQANAQAQRSALRALTPVAE